MFEDIDVKLKVVAYVQCILGIIGSVILGIIIMAADLIGIGLLVMAYGSFMSWLSSLGIYGLGEAVDRATVAAQKTQHILQRLDNPTTANTQHSSAPNSCEKPSQNSLVDVSKDVPYKPIVEHSDNVTPIVVDEETVRCPLCGTAQRSSRRVCFQCGTTFKK